MQVLLKVSRNESTIIGHQINTISAAGGRFVSDTSTF
jgi:hypothetical protein